MKWVARKVFSAELLAAIRVTAFGQWWSVRALHRLRKFSGEHSGVRAPDHEVRR